MVEHWSNKPRVAGSSPVVTIPFFDKFSPLVLEEVEFATMVQRDAKNIVFIHRYVQRAGVQKKESVL